MPWHPVSPVGNRSVRFNRADMNDNTTYIGNTLGDATNTLQDHYWNIGANEDGRHRQVTMRSFGENIQAPLAPLMDAAIYINRETDNELQVRARTSTEDWRLNLWQTVRKGTFISDAGTSVFTISNVDAAPFFGMVLIYLTTSPWLAMSGYFYTDGTIVHGFSSTTTWQGFPSNLLPPIELAQNPSTNNALRARVPPGTAYNTYRSKTYQYIIFWRNAF